MRAFINPTTEAIVDRRVSRDERDERDYLAELRAVGDTPPRHVRVHASLPPMTSVRVRDTLWVSPELLEQARAEVQLPPV